MIIWYTGLQRAVLEKEEQFDDFLRTWAIQYNIRQWALKVLMTKLNREIRQN